MFNLDCFFTFIKDCSEFFPRSREFCRRIFTYRLPNLPNCSADSWSDCAALWWSIRKFTTKKKKNFVFTLLGSRSCTPRNSRELIRNLNYKAENKNYYR